MEEPEEEEEGLEKVEEEGVWLQNLGVETLGLLKHLNAVLFPIYYHQKYYTQALASGPFSKLAFYRDTCVGSITCRVEKTLGGRRLYILTLGVLAPYRRLGIGSKLMKSVLDLCDQEEDFLDVYLHVQVNNEEALRFYEKFRFEVRETIRNYYRRIDPPDCHLLSKDLAGKKTLQADGRSEVMFSLKGGQPL